MGGRLGDTRFGGGGMRWKYEAILEHVIMLPKILTG